MTEKEKTILKYLKTLYKNREADKTFTRAKALLAKYKDKIKTRDFQFSERDVVLITYGDSFLKPGENPIKTLGFFLNTYLTGLVTVVHVLPFFPYSSDDGFSVVDYKEVNPDLGNWDEIDSLGKKFHLMFDAVINHISAKSKEFQGFLEGDEKYKNFFIVVGPGMNTSRVFRPRALPLTTRFETENGPLNLWTTFSTDQIDLNFRNPEVFLFVLDVLLFYAMHGASIIRFDAIAFLWKESGTTCLHLPQTHAVIKLYRQFMEMAVPHLKIITETNVPHKDNISYFGNGNDEAHLVYNFALPPLSVDALLRGDSRILSKWAWSLRLPGKNTNFYNFTASHDGIGLLPSHNILSKEQIQGLIDKTEESGGRVSYKNNADGTKTAYELNISLFDLLSDPDPERGLEISINRFVASQAIALSLIGVPAIYYHSIIGSRNYYKGVEKTGANRAINREKVYIGSLEEELKTAGSTRNLVFQRISTLISTRRKLRAFNPRGRQKVFFVHPGIFCLERQSPEKDETVLSLINVTDKQVNLSMDTGGKRDVLSGRVFSGDLLSVSPYEVLWLN
jgi:glycosidase